MQALHLPYWGHLKSYFKYSDVFRANVLVGSYWGAHGALEIPTAGSMIFFFADPFCGSILLCLSRPLSLSMQIYCLFTAWEIHHHWPYVRCSEFVCQEHLPAQPLRQSPQLWASSGTPQGSSAHLPDESWMWTGNNSSCKPGQSTLEHSWCSVWVYPTMPCTDIRLLNKTHSTGLELLVKKKPQKHNIKPPNPLGITLLSSFGCLIMNIYELKMCVMMQYDAVNIYFPEVNPQCYHSSEEYFT